jgi:uncharacterized protein with PIN domain
MGSVSGKAKKLFSNCYMLDGTPVRCPYCGGYRIRTKVRDSSDGINSLEEEYYCGECGIILAFWSYGHFDTELREDPPNITKAELTMQNTAGLLEDE